MGKLIVTEFMTLDGVAQAPGAPDEDRDSGFTHGGSQAPLLDQSSGDAMFEQASHMDALLLGRKTYEIFADYWPHAPEEVRFTALLNAVPKYVASRIHYCMLQAAASELAARQKAMKSATDNAEELIKKYTQIANQARQAGITQEISEIVGGVNALADAKSGSE